MSGQDINSLKQEITSLNKQLVLLGEARNKEILDLQRRFADQIRELQRSKGLDSVDEINNLNKKVEDLESALALKDKEIQNLKSANIDLEKKLKEATEKNEKTSLLLEKARIDALKAQSEAAEAKKLADEANSKNEEIDYEELLKPFEEQLEKLKEVITKQNAEIVGLRNLVHEECTERMRLQKQLGIFQQTNQQQNNQQQQNETQVQPNNQQQQREQNLINSRGKGRGGRTGGSRPESKISMTQPNRSASKLNH